MIDPVSAGAKTSAPAFSSSPAIAAACGAAAEVPKKGGAVGLWLESLGAGVRPGYACYTGVRDAILGTAEELPTNVSDALLGATNPHNEDLLDVR